VNLTILNRLPQTEDSLATLLQKLLRGPRAGTGLASLSRNASTTTPSNATLGFQSVLAVLTITVPGAAGNLVLSIEGQDSAGTWIPLALDTPFRTAAGSYALQVSSFPASTGTSTLPATATGLCWDLAAFQNVRATVTHSTADAVTYSVAITLS
jgi:hypothetical protein